MALALAIGQGALACLPLLQPLLDSHAHRLWPNDEQADSPIPGESWSAG